MLEGVVPYLLPSVGFILALVLLAHILRARRSPTSTLAWLMAVIFVPYVGVPLYILLSGRKIRSRIGDKPMIEGLTAVRHSEDDLEHQLASLVYRGGFPPTRRNRLTFLFSGEETYHDILRIIGSAQQSVHVATYVLGRDETGRAIVDALSRKAADGLDVCLMMDALGSVTIDSGFLSPLHKAGGRTAFFMPMAHMPFRGRANLRNHRKMVIVDGQTAIVGGMNLGKEYMGPGAEEDRWTDFSLRITGPAVGQALELFRSDWAFAATEALERPTPPRQAPDDTASSALQFLASGPDVENDALREALMMSLFRAAERVWMVTPYFVPDDLLLEALCLAAKRGIDLRLVIPKKSNHRLADLAREGYLSELQESGAQVYLYRPRMLHAKAILIDHTVAITGSANLDMRSLLLNYEVGLCIYSQDEIRQLKTWMHDLMADCTPRHAHGSTMRSIIEGVARLFAPLL